MNEQSDIYQLIIRKSPQVETLRNRAVSGNRETFSAFCNAIDKLLKDRQHHEYAYKQINEFLISAQPAIVDQIHKNVLPLVAQQHCRQDLDQYIVFWKQIMPGTTDHKAHPNLNQRLKGVRLANPQLNLMTLSSRFKKYNAIFKNNTERLFQKKYQFFQDFDDSIVSDSIDQGVSSDIIEMDMQQIKLIKQKVESGPVDELTAEEYLKKIKNFLSLKPKTLRKELSIDYNNDRIWAHQFLRNYDSFLEDGSLNLHKHFNPSNLKIDTIKQTDRQVIGSSQAVININNITQQVYYVQQPFKKIQSKRFELTTQNLPSNPNLRQLGRQTALQSVNDKLNIDVAGRRTQIPQVIVNTDEMDLRNMGNTQNNKSRQHLSNPIPQPTYNMVNSQFNILPNGSSHRVQPPIGDSNNFQLRSHQRSPDRMTNNSLGKSRSRPKIFGNSSMRSREQHKQMEQPEEGMLPVIKYTGGQPIMRNTTSNIPASYNNHIDPTSNNPNLKVNSNNNQSNLFRHTMNEVPTRNWTPLSNPNQNNRQSYGRNQQFIMNTNDAKNNNENSKMLYTNPNQNMYSQSALTPKHNKITGFYDTISPNTAFGNKTAYTGGASYKKLSEFNRQKRQRKMGLQNQELNPIQGCLVLPYCQNFNDMVSFSRFRRNCLQDNFTLYASPLLLISCIIRRETQNKIKAQILYHNQSHADLTLETLYRVPKCLKIQKYSQISKRWTLKDQTQHLFGLQLLQFPLEPCLLNLKYAVESNHEDLKYHQPRVVSLPITMRNFLEYLVLNQQQWIEKWTRWTELDNFRICRNIILEKQVLHEDQLTFALKQFTILQPIEGYSVKQFGAYCRQSNFDGLTFLIRISQRIENIMTLEIVADRQIRDEDHADYLEYSLNMWSMLLAKIDNSSMA